MFAYLRGTVQSKEMADGSADRLVLEVGGIGYELTISRRTLLSIGQPGDEATVHTKLAVRENDWTLFGFSSVQEREMFGLLQSVTGVGPKLALALIGTLSPNELAQAILEENHKMLSQAPGVGSKVAQRLILELKSKVEDFNSRRGFKIPQNTNVQSEVFQEVRTILDSLGYTPTEISRALKQAEEDKVDHDVEFLVRYSLKTLGTTLARK